MFYLLLTISLVGVPDSTKAHELKRYQEKKQCITDMLEMQRRFSQHHLKHFKPEVSCKEIV